MHTKKLTIYTDGAARSNPLGNAAIGVVIKDAENETVKTISQHIGITSNNRAEYLAIIAALETAQQMSAEEIILYSDSELVVRQINGRYRVRNAGLKPLYQKAKALINSFQRFNMIHIPRENNREADKLANLALDELI